MDIQLTLCACKPTTVIHFKENFNTVVQAFGASAIEISTHIEALFNQMQNETKAVHLLKLMQYIFLQK